MITCPVSQFQEEGGNISDLSILQSLLAEIDIRMFNFYIPTSIVKSHYTIDLEKVIERAYSKQLSPHAVVLYDNEDRRFQPHNSDQLSLIAECWIVDFAEPTTIQDTIALFNKLLANRAFL